MERQLRISLSSWQIIVIHILAAGRKLITLFFTSAERSHGPCMSWENYLSSWARKIVSQPLEECQVGIFPMLKSNLFIFYVTEQWRCLSVHTWIASSFCVWGFVRQLTSELRPSQKHLLLWQHAVTVPLDRKWGQGWGHFLHILLVRPHRLLRRASNNRKILYFSAHT